MWTARQLVVVAIAACAATPALHARPWSPPAQASTPTDSADLSIQRALIDESNAARATGDYATARAIVREAVANLLARPATEQDEPWLAILDSAGRAAIDAQDARTAKAAWKKVYEVRSSVHPDEHPALQEARLNLAATLSMLGDLAGARALEEKLLEVLARTVPDDDRNLQSARMNLASTLFAQGDVAGARALLEKALDVVSRTFPDEHPQLQLAWQNLAATLFAQGDLAGARALDEKVFQVRSRTLPDHHPDLQVARQNLATTMRAQGELAGARALQEKVLEINARTLPSDHPRLQAARHNLGSTLLKLGDLAGARALFELVVEVDSRTLPDDHPDLQMARLNLAATIKKLGDLEGARALQEKVLAVRTRTLPDEHPDLQKARGNLANTIQSLGDFAGARALKEKVLEVYSRTFPDDHPDLQTARLNLVVALHMEGDLAGALALGEKVLEVCTRTLPDEDPDLQAARSSLAGTRSRLGDFAGAEALLEKVLEIRTRTLPDDHPDLQTVRINLAVVRATSGDFGSALALEDQALEILSRTLPDDHPDLQSVRMYVAATLARELARERHGAGGAGARTIASEEKSRRCAELIGAVCRAQVHAARAAILTSSGREAEARCVSLTNDLHRSLSFAQGYGLFEPLRELDAPAFVFAETTRGAAIASAELTRRAVSAPKYAALRDALREAGGALAALAQKGTTSEEFDRARVKRESVERELVELARQLSGGKPSGAELDLESLADTLAADEATVSFRRFVRWGVEVVDALDSTGQPSVRPTSVARLCAFVVRSSKSVATTAAAPEPRLALIDLGPIEPIESAARAWREGLGLSSDSRGVAASARRESSGSPHANGARLRELIFDPLLPSLTGARRIVVVLDDVLHLIPLDALPLDDGALLGERWQIETRTTLTELLLVSSDLEASSQLVAFGDVEYGADAKRDQGAAPSAADTTSPLVAQEVTPLAGEALAHSIDASRHESERAGMLRGGAWAQGFAALPGTGAEVRGIARCFADQFGADAEVELCERGGATRERLLSLAPRARYLHIATHGWFAPESIRSWSDPEPLDERTGLGLRISSEEQVKGMSPMLLCGLALAGANLPDSAADRAPGLVTAEELSTLDLSKCELAVLSACDTNVGERQAGQGVASLQKALQMAGARSVITSLWKVPDEATKELMLDFYRRLWVEKKPKHQALWEAKTKLREAKDESGNPKYTTRDWAAWVLTGSPG